MKKPARQTFKVFFGFYEVKEHGRNVPPTYNESIRKVLAKALNKNRRLILLSISNEEMETLNSLLKRVSREHGISLSTLKLNARILRDLGLVSCNGFVKTTESGELVKRLLT